MVCNKCRNNVEDNMDYCPFCGTKIKKKSKVLAGFLGIFFGMFGIHNFYLGYTLKGIIQLCITLFLLCLGSHFVSLMFLWGVIEGILIFCGVIPIYKNGNNMPILNGVGAIVSTANNMNSTKNLQNNFKFKINNVIYEDNATILVGDVELGSISIGDIGRIKKANEEDSLECKINSIIEDEMNVSFSMGKNVMIKIDKLDLDGYENILVNK